MGIQVEYNPDLALRAILEHESGRRKKEECIPVPLEAGKAYSFLKSGQRNYWLHGEIPLLETKGGGDLSKPIASIRIIEATHFMHGGEVYTRGVYEVVEIFNDESIHFNGFAKI